MIIPTLSRLECSVETAEAVLVLSTVKAVMQ